MQNFHTESAACWEERQRTAVIAISTVSGEESWCSVGLLTMADKASLLQGIESPINTSDLDVEYLHKLEAPAWI